MKQLIYTPMVALIMMGLQLEGVAQCDTIMTMCEKNITEQYISDGQVYRALVNGNEVAEFSMTLFEGNTYRIAACSGLEDGNLFFTMLDPEGQALFKSEDFAGAPYWDFIIENTLQVTIETRLNPHKSQSGCAVIVVGFKKD
jgi:hypothetical protein